VQDIEFADTINPGGIATWSGNFSDFLNKGGKLLTYHGTADPVRFHVTIFFWCLNTTLTFSFLPSTDKMIPSKNSKRFYDLISKTMRMRTLDSFYRLFMVPGMFHCQRSGAWAFGQGALDGIRTNAINDTSHNILLALVDWVESEGRNAPENIIGVDIENPDRPQRTHCRYPYRSHWTETRVGHKGWRCVLG
jgi:feruloyl esterase